MGEKQHLKRAFEFAERQVEELISMHPEQFPMYTLNGKWVVNGETWTNWCEGFLGGLMWLFYTRSGRDIWRARAEQYSRLIEPRKLDRSVHDLGFLFWPTWKKWYDVTGDTTLRDVVITAGKTMGERYVESGGYLHSFIGEESLFIDIMMNVGIVFYAAEQIEDERLFTKADQHCRTTRRFLVRGDGSTAHEGLFDTQSGEFVKQSTHQGWRGDSCWARGLAWAMYGFFTAYQYTDDPGYLSTALDCADFYIANTSWDPASEAGPGIPPNDFDDPKRPVQYESSAAAIAASALLDISKRAPTETSSAEYRHAALQILETLCGPNYLANETKGWEGILQHGVYHNAKGLGVDESVMWGEYFFVEAVDKALSLAEE